MHTILITLYTCIQMYILYSLPCPSPGDSSFCMHCNAIATALWQLLTATNPRTPTHLAAGPLPQWPHVYMNGEWVGIQGYLSNSRRIYQGPKILLQLYLLLWWSSILFDLPQSWWDHISPISQSSTRPRCKVTNQSAYQPMGHCGNLMSWLKFKMIYSTDVGDIFAWW